MTKSKSNPGNYFEDFHIGMEIRHATPLTVTEGDISLYRALTGSRHALYSSRHFAAANGFAEQPIDPLLAFHVVFGKTVPDISLNAVANLGYADGRFKIPVVAGAGGAPERIEEGDDIVLDGDDGILQIRPSADVVQSYRDKRDLRSERQAAYAAEAAEPTVTKDGRHIDLLMNAGLALDMPHLDTTGAAGVGLYRTELQFLIGRQLPKAADQERLYRNVMTLAGDKPVVFRTADLGSDKSASYMKPIAEANPAMGWRGIRMAVDRPGILRPQLRALIAAAAGRELHIMFPMITLASEVDAARGFLDQEIAIAEARGRELPSKIHMGVMIETPAAAWRVEEILPKVDFLSVGGNDLAQFYFAADRDSELTQRRFDPMEAGFLSFLKRLCEKTNAAGAPLSYCGEQTSDPVMAVALLAVGLRRFSLPATAIGPFRRIIRALDAAALSAWMEEALKGGGSLRPALSDKLQKDGLLG